MPKEKIILHPSAEANGMANMTAELMRANIAGSTFKSLCFNLLRANIGLKVPDAEVSATLVFSRGQCVVYDGVAGDPEIVIEADSEDLLALSNINTVAGLPNYFDEKGRELLAKGHSHKIKIEGMLTHPLAFVLLTNVLSVN